MSMSLSRPPTPSRSTITLISLPPSHILDIPPPTKNDLPATERARLMRSTRKIGALLGTTPHFVEFPSYPSPGFSSSSTSLLPIGPAAHERGKEERERLVARRKRRQGSVFELVGTGSGEFEVVPLESDERSSFESARSAGTSYNESSTASIGRKQRAHPAALFLCLETRPSQARQDVDVVSLPVTPAVAAYDDDTAALNEMPTTPATPLTPLSSNTPSLPRFSTSPLAFASPLPLPPLSSSPTRAHHTKSPSASPPKTPLGSYFKSDSSTSTLQARRKKMAKLARHLGENVPPELVFPSSTAKERAQRRRRSVSVDFGKGFNVGMMGVGNGNGGETWVGEWNMDIKDVQRELRALKGR